jgi:hypothetical protein
MALYDTLDDYRNRLSGLLAQRDEVAANVARNAQNPMGLLQSIGQDIRDFHAKSLSAEDARRSVMPEVRAQGEKEWSDQAMALGNMFGPGSIKVAKIAPTQYQLAHAEAQRNAALPVAKGSSAKGVISDWKWRNNKDVQNEVGLQEVPQYIQDGYGKFMQDQRARAESGALGTRDLLKAYGITRSSINRASRNITDDLSGGEIRPEGYFSEWLLSPAGKQYLDAAEVGKIDKQAIGDIKKRFVPFGMADTLAKDLEYAATNIPPLNGSANAAVAGPMEQWRVFAQNLNGIGPSKSGFIASLLGRGDIPTLDARQLILHTGSPAKEASKYIRRGEGAGGNAAVDRLAKRQQEMGLAINEELNPFYQHLTHHAVWDKIGGTQTTHDDLIRAMRFASMGGMGLLGAGAYNNEQP